MALFERFERWQPEDFDAFLAPKWASNRFNVERGRVKERLRSAFEQIGERQPELLQGLDVWVSRHDPCFFNQHSVPELLAVVVRSQAQREALEHADPRLSATQPDRYHAHAGMRMDATSVELRLSVPEEAHYDLQMSDEARQGLVELGMLLGQSDLGSLGGLQALRRFERDEALAWPDPLAQLVEWLELAAPLLRKILRPVEGAQEQPVALAAKAVEPSENPDDTKPLPPLGPAMRPTLQLGPAGRGRMSPAAVFADSPATPAQETPTAPATRQATAGPRQPYRPQMPAPQRQRPTSERPDLDRILPMGARQALQDLLQDEEQRREQAHRGPGYQRDHVQPRDQLPARDQVPPRDHVPAREPDRRPPLHADQRRDVRPEQRTDQRQDQRQDPRMDQRRDPRMDQRQDQRPDQRQDQRRDPRIDQRQDQRPDQRQDQRRSDPRPDERQAPRDQNRPDLPPIGTAVVLTGGLLAGKEGVFVAMNGPNVKVKVGVLEFEVAPHQVRVK